MTVPANGSVDEPLTFTPYADAQPGSFPFTVSVTDSHNAASGTATATLVIAGAPVVQPDTTAHGVVVSLTPAQATAGQGTSAQYVVQLSNTGSADDTFGLTLNGLPKGVAASLGQTTIDVPPGASNFRDDSLMLSVAPGTSPGTYPFTVTATSTSDSTVSNTTSGTLVVVASGVEVKLNPPSGASGSGFAMTVTNPGSTPDTYKLALGGPAALVANLATQQVTIPAGGSQVVPISTGAVNFAVQGSLELMGMATSQTHPAVQGEAAAALTIPGSLGMTASFSPASVTLSAPGAATFLLTVQNTGNTEDSYTATIIGTSGPVTASLVGLDGAPTQTIPIFRLPGLSTGVIMLQADVSQAGSGTIKVLISSLNNTDITSTAVATASAGGSAPGSGTGSGSGSGTGTGTGPGSGTGSGSGTGTGTGSGSSLPDGPTIRSLQRFGIHHMPTTIVLHFDQPLNPARTRM